MKILHIIRDKGHELALSTALAQSTDISQKVTLLLIHDAVLTRAETLKGLETFALKDDVEARGVKSEYPLLDYKGMLGLVFESDRVVTW
ncbi:MAG: DsrH/TusB family sulfur metabolism protein [Planctomycetota bacterium]